MITSEEADYRTALLHLHYALHHMRRLLATTSDWTAKALLEEEFATLRRHCREHARCQCGRVKPRGNRG
jgi:hypothetical protein